MVKKILLSSLIVLLVGGLVLGGLYFYSVIVGFINGSDQTLLSPLDKVKNQFEDLANSTIKFNHSFDEAKPLNILLLGIDRRSRAETAYRTDIMILMTINTKDKRVILTSVPRDLWVGQGAGRVNAVYQVAGWEGIQQAFFDITGQKPDKYILTDFADFSWVVDAMGGVPVTVERTFTDSEYPVDATKGYQTVTFVQGAEKLTGTRALIYARSRHGSNTEGSDWMRMRRQHLILKGMQDAVVQPESIFNPMVVENAFKTVTQGKMDTNLGLDDAKYLWSFYKDKDQYTIESLFMDNEHVYNPPMSEYGGAWVLVPQGKSYSAFHKVVNDAMYGIKPEPSTAPPTEPTMEKTAN